MTDWHEGDRAWLVPTLPTAPAAAYRLPEVTVTAVLGVRLVVQLGNGTPIETDVANIRRTRPEPPAERTPKPRPRPELPDGYDETPLW